MNEYSPRQRDFDGDGSLSGEVKAFIAGGDVGGEKEFAIRAELQQMGEQHQAKWEGYDITVPENIASWMMVGFPSALTHAPYHVVKEDDNYLLTFEVELNDHNQKQSFEIPVAVKYRVDE